MKKQLLLLLALVLAAPVFSQSITKADFLARVSTTITSTTHSTFGADTNGLDAKLTALVGMTGTGQTWDFSSIAFVPGSQATSYTQTGVSGATGAEDPKLSGATHTVKTTSSETPGITSWTFYALNGETLYTHGTTADSLGTLLYKLINEPPAVEFVFPVSYGASWTAQTTNSLIDFGGESINREQRKEVTIDGAGTLIVPGKPGAPAVRMKTVTYGKTGPYLTLYFYDTVTFYSIMSVDGRYTASISPSRPSPIPGQPSITGSASYSEGTLGGGTQDVTEAPQLTMPADGALLTATDVSMTWEMVTNASSYRVQISQSADFQSTLHDNTFTGTSSSTYSFTPGQYYWRVAGISAESKDGPWSAVRSFTISTSGVEEHNHLFSLEQNHPNPFGTVTKISYTLKADAFVTISIYDQFGNKVAMPVEGVEHQGMHVLTFDALNLASGQYYCTLTAGGESKTIPMTIVR